MFDKVFVTALALPKSRTTVPYPLSADAFSDAFNPVQPAAEKANIPAAANAINFFIIPENLFIIFPFFCFFTGVPAASGGRVFQGSATSALHSADILSGNKYYAFLAVNSLCVPTVAQITDSQQNASGALTPPNAVVIQ